MTGNKTTPNDQDEETDIPKAAELSRAKREERLAPYEHIVALRNQGFSQTAIAAQVGIDHVTVSRWLRSDTFASRTTISAYKWS